MGLRYLALGAISAVLLSLAHGTWTGLSAEERFPAHPVHLIVPAPAGGSLDIGIRIIEPRLSALLGAPIVIVNRSGASGAVAMAAVAKAPADGYTLAATSTSTLTVISLTQNLPYGLDSFIPIGNYAVDAGMIVVRSDAPWKTLDEMVEHARQFPGKLTYGSYGVGSLSTLNMEAIKGAPTGLMFSMCPIRAPLRPFSLWSASRSTSELRPTAQSPLFCRPSLCGRS